MPTSDEPWRTVIKEVHSKALSDAISWELTLLTRRESSLFLPSKI